MRVRMLDVEGTPAELAALPELQEALRSLGNGTTQPQEPASAESADDDTEADDVLPDDVRDFIRSRAGSANRAAVTERFVREVLGWGTTAALGRSRNSPDGFGPYLMLYARGPRRVGAFVYVNPGAPKTTFRLIASYANGFQHAIARGVADSNGYAVTVPLTPQGAYDEALQLARTALEVAERTTLRDAD